MEQGDGVEMNPMKNALLSSKGRQLVDLVDAKAKNLKVP